MAYQKLQSGEFMVVGPLPRDAELKQVGQNNSSKTSFSVKASEKTLPDGKKEANWTNCVAWHDMARICADFKKGDFVMVVGKIESREYNGKTYKDLVVEYAAKAGGTSISVPASALKPAENNVRIDASDDVDLSGFEELLSDGDIPF